LYAHCGAIQQQNKEKIIKKEQKLVPEDIVQSIPIKS
jgi:hypothetical protein